MGGGGGGSLSEEPLADPLVAGLVGRQHLDGHLLAKSKVFAEEDRAHAAGADLVEDLEAVEAQATGLAGQELPGLELCQHSGADEGPGSGYLGGGGRPSESRTAALLPGAP